MNDNYINGQPHAEVADENTTSGWREAGRNIAVIPFIFGSQAVTNHVLASFKPTNLKPGGRLTWWFGTAAITCVVGAAASKAVATELYDPLFDAAVSVKAVIDEQQAEKNKG